MNFRQLDLNLLRVLCAIHRTGSVTEAGQQLALSQSATSNALARLRHCFGDALFVRSPSGLHPTRLAQRIAPLVADHLLQLEAALCEGESFEPASGCVHWRLSLSDLGEMMFLPALAAPTASLLNNVQRVLERLDLGGANCVRLRHYGAVPELVRGTDLVAIVPQMFADAVAARHDLRVWQLPDGTSYDVMMVWHQSVNGDPAQRWLREQVRHLFGQGRIAANEPVDCAGLG